MMKTVTKNGILSKPVILDIIKNLSFLDLINTCKIHQIRNIVDKTDFWKKRLKKLNYNRSKSWMCLHCEKERCLQLDGCKKYLENWKYQDLLISKMNAPHSKDFIKDVNNQRNTVLTFMGIRELIPFLNKTLYECHIYKNRNMTFIYGQTDLNTHRYSLKVLANTLPFLTNLLKLTLKGIYFQDDMVLNSSNLTEITIKKCINTHLPENLFRNVKNLQKLKITKSKIESLPERIFSGMDQLYHLKLNQNLLKILPCDIFTNLHQLKVLDLTGNRLATLPQFKDIPQLEDLFISNNNLSILPEDTFENNYALEELNLSHNQIREFPEKIFWNCESLINLDLSHNPYTKLPLCLFVNLYELRDLNLSHSNLSSLGYDVFAVENQNLEVLDLNNTGVEELPGDTLSWVNVKV